MVGSTHQHSKRWNKATLQSLWAIINDHVQEGTEGQTNKGIPADVLQKHKNTKIQSVIKQSFAGIWYQVSLISKSKGFLVSQLFLISQLFSQIVKSCKLFICCYMMILSLCIGFSTYNLEFSSICSAKELMMVLAF